jgi:hypothetical protein
LVAWQNRNPKDKEGSTLRAIEIDHIRLFKVGIIRKAGIDGQVSDEPCAFMQNETLMMNDEIQIV